uniref:C3H1-type domain-containing protein n=1 Tax=Nelumbo nucifera TaxID=4432 RepID=A0A822YNU1_NELNU|nr:TPA_asm: hypothetical protein HUJ06_011850 [Nelumbo nucifera]
MFSLSCHALKGFCQFGDSCKYFHPKQNIQSPGAQGLISMMALNYIYFHWRSFILYQSKAKVLIWMKNIYFVAFSPPTYVKFLFIIL